MRSRSGLPTNTAHLGPIWISWTNTDGSFFAKPMWGPHYSPCGSQQGVTWACLEGTVSLLRPPFYRDGSLKSSGWHSAGARFWRFGDIDTAGPVRGFWHGGPRYTTMAPGEVLRSSGSCVTLVLILYQRKNAVRSAWTWQINPTLFNVWSATRVSPRTVLFLLYTLLTSGVTLLTFSIWIQKMLR